MTTKVVVYNEGPKNVIIDDGAHDIQSIGPGERTTFYVFKRKMYTIFEEGDETAIRESEG